MDVPKLKNYTASFEDGTRSFQVLENLTEPCQVCGVPACGEECILWFEKDGIRLAIIFDGGLFGLAIQEALSNYLKENDYDSVPTFLKEYNENKGWYDCWSCDGFSLKHDDFMSGLLLLEKHNNGMWIDSEDINSLRCLALDSKKNKSLLKIVRE